MPDAPRIALAAFDMAGTTIDDHGDVYRALSDCVTETGVPVSAEDLQTWMGAEKSEAIRALIIAGGAPEPDAETVADRYDRFRALLTEYYRQRPPVALPGIEDMIRTLRAAGIRVALTTGFATDVAEPLLAGLGWSVAAGGTPESGTGIVVDAVVCASEVPRGRPYPHMIHRAMERTGTRRVDEVLVAGDTVVDVEAGAAAGAAHVVGVLTGGLDAAAFSSTPATAVLGSAAHVPQLLGLEPHAAQNDGASSAAARGVAQVSAVRAGRD